MPSGKSRKSTIKYHFMFVRICDAGYDATSHFETVVDDVMDMYKRISGKALDLEKMDPRGAAGFDDSHELE